MQIFLQPSYRCYQRDYLWVLKAAGATGLSLFVGKVRLVGKGVASSFSLALQSVVAGRVYLLWFSIL